MATWDKIAGDVIAGVYDIKTVGFKRLSDSATIPTKAHATDSGFDLYASEDVIIEPGETAIVPTGIAVELPAGYEAQVRPRSGVTVNTKLRVQLGTIDNGYTGEIGVIVDNIYDETTERFSNFELIDGSVTPARRNVMDGAYLIRKGDRLAQLIIQYIPNTYAIELEELKTTYRGGKGFGSTGVRDK